MFTEKKVSRKVCMDIVRVPEANSIPGNICAICVDPMVLKENGMKSFCFPFDDRKHSEMWYLTHNILEGHTRPEMKTCAEN